MMQINGQWHERHGSLWPCRDQWCGLRSTVLGQDRSKTEKIGLGLGLAHCGLGLDLASLVLCCETRSCHARHHNLEGHSNFSNSFSILCLEHRYCEDQRWPEAFTYLKVKFAKCLCLFPVVLFLVLLFWSWSCKQRSWSWSWSCYFGLGLLVLVLRIWSCIHHWPWLMSCGIDSYKDGIQLGRSRNSIHPLTRMVLECAECCNASASMCVGSGMNIRLPRPASWSSECLKLRCS